MIRGHRGRTTEYVETICPECVWQITAYPETTKSVGMISVTRLRAHCPGEDPAHSPWRRLKRAWLAWRGCPDTEVYVETSDDLTDLIAALERARGVAFPTEAAL